MEKSGYTILAGGPGVGPRKSVGLVALTVRDVFVDPIHSIEHNALGELLRNVIAHLQENWESLDTFDDYDCDEKCEVNKKQNTEKYPSFGSNLSQSTRKTIRYLSLKENVVELNKRLLCIG